MARLSSHSLFTRLYITIAIAMIVSGTLSIILIERIHVQGTINDYVAFTDDIYADLLKEDKIATSSKLKNLNEQVNNVEGYLISWKILRKNNPPCDDCELNGRSGEVDVYGNEMGQLFAVYQLKNIEARLVIYENHVFDVANEQEPAEVSFFSKYSFYEIEEIALLLTVFLSIAIAIYWPVRVIKRQIENLIKIQYQFGMGDLHARAGDSFTKPLDKMAGSFNSMANAISETVNKTQVFAQAVPHEVRTPLSRIQLAVGLLSQNNNNKQQMELLNSIHTYVGDITELIDQVVSFSKLNAVKDEREVSLYQTILLSAFIESRLEATKCSEKVKVVRHIDDSLTITTNPAYIRLLIDNLLKNACIHGKTQIIVTLVKIDGHIELCVEDDGDGIPTEAFETIFLPFSRIDVSRSRKTGGLGLGLAISKAACKRMNTILTVTNSPSAGAKFTCKFQT